MKVNIADTLSAMGFGDVFFFHLLICIPWDTGETKPITTCVKRPLQEPGMRYREASHQVVCTNELPFFHKIKARIHHPHPHGRVEFLYTELIGFRLFTVLRNSFSQPF